MQYRKDMIGEINYDIISESEALLDIKVFLTEDAFSKIMDKNKKNNHIFFVIDRSGSMSNCIDEVRGCAKRCVEQHFAQQNKGYFNPPHSLLFDSSLIKNEENNLQNQLHFLDQYCRASGGTNFVLPLNDIMQFVNNTEVSSLYVLFMTDGQDGNERGTIALADQLKQLLMKKDVFSWFNVVGLGEGHSAQFLGQLAAIGTQRGNYEIVTN